MDLDLNYVVTYKDFLVSFREYRRRSRWTSFVYYLDAWVLPCAGILVVVTYLFGLMTKNRDITYALDWLAVVGLIAAIVLPTLYRLRLRKTYQQRIALTESGRVQAQVGQTGIRFVIQNKVDVRYEWNAFSDFREAKGVLTLFVEKAAFHTISKHDVTEADWNSLLSLVSLHVQRY